jgi:orotidine-5'-phosphate decarboxylase
VLRAAVQAVADATAPGAAVPVVLGVTVLTSDADTSPFAARLDAAVEAGCGGVVCAATEAARVRAAAPHLVVVTPGIRQAGGAVHDQARVATPAVAIGAGADLLVVGRAATGADDPEAAAAAIHAEVEAALEVPRPA